MTDLTQIPVPNEGPITDKIKEIYERSFPPEEQIPLPELLTSAQMDQVSFLAWIDPSLPAGEAGNYQQRVRRLAFYERNGFEVTNMLTHEADQTYRVLARDGIVSPQRLEEALNSVTDDPAYASRVTTD